MGLNRRQFPFSRDVETADNTARSGHFIAGRN